VARRHGDYAVCGVGAIVALDAGGQVESARVGLISVGPTPVIVDVTDAVAGQPHDAVDAAAAGWLVTHAVDPDADIHATAEYRRHLAGTLTTRAVFAAAARAGERFR
jgi:carbon-monoxide dehydrogenase medium subunit